MDISQENLETLEKLALVLSSSLVAAIVTMIGNFFIQKRGYKHEYYKKLLDKRIAAYEKVELIIGKMRGLVQLENGKMCPIICAYGQNNFADFFSTLGTAINDAIWISESTGMEIMKINVFLMNEIDYNIDENKDYGKQLMKIGSEKISAFKSHRNSLENQLYKDLKSLHEIRKFVKKEVNHTDGLQLNVKPYQLQKRTDM